MCLPIGVDDVFRGHFPARHCGFEFLQIVVLDRSQASRYPAGPVSAPTQADAMPSALLPLNVVPCNRQFDLTHSAPRTQFSPEPLLHLRSAPARGLARILNGSAEI